MSASAANSSYDYVLNIVVVGDTAVGRTCFIRRLKSDTFYPNTSPTIGGVFITKIIHIDGFDVKYDVWEISGQERYTHLLPGTNGLIFVYDITDWSFFENLTFWMKQISRTVGENVVKVIVGNKCDLEERRAVDYETAKKFAESVDIPLFEVSAKSGVNVERTFETLVATILKEKRDICKEKK